MTGDTTIAHRLPLLARMANDMDGHGSMRASTAAAMWTAYSAHAVLTAWVLARRSVRLPIPPGPARVAGGALITAGAGLCVAGMRPFTGVEELTGMRNLNRPGFRGGLVAVVRGFLEEARRTRCLPIPGVHARFHTTETHPGRPSPSVRSASTGPGRDVWLAGEPVASTRTESDVLAALSEPPRIVLTRRQLINHVWGPAWLGDGACSTFASGVYHKDRTGFAKALKPIYPAPDGAAAQPESDTFRDSVWDTKYPHAVGTRQAAWERIIPHLAFPRGLRGDSTAGAWD